MKRPIVRAAAVLGVAAVLFGMSTVPAFAATGRSVPSGNKLYAMNCNPLAASGFPDLQLFSVTSSTGDSTAIGTGSGSGDPFCAWQTAWDAANGTVYALVGNGPGQPSILATVNRTTGANDPVNPLEFGGSAAAVAAFAIGTDGTAYAIANDGGTFGIYTVNLTTGDMTFVTTTQADAQTNAFAVDPASGDFYVMRNDNTFGAIDVTTGDVDSFGPPSNAPAMPTDLAMQIDSNENVWVESSYDGTAGSDLWSFGLSNGLGVDSGTTTSSGTAYSTASLLLVPTLASTTHSSSKSGLYAFACDQSPGNVQFYSVNKTNAIAKVIGSGGGDINSATCVGQAAWDAVSHKAYFPTWSSADVQALATVNAKTGISTKVADFTILGTPVDGTSTVVDAMAIGTDGSAFAIVDNLGTTSLYSLDLGTGGLTLVGDTGDNIWGFAVNPHTGAFYTINSTGVVSSIDVTSGDLTTIGTVNVGGTTPETFSLQIDTSGTLWVEEDTGTSDADLWKFTLSGLASGDHIGTIGTGSVSSRVPFYTVSLLLIPGSTSSGPSLAFTGGVDGGQIELGAGAASIIVLLGAGFLIGSRRRRHATRLGNL